MGKTNEAIKDIISGKVMNPGDFRYDWQEFVLNRVESLDGECEDIEAQFKGYNRGFIDGMKIAMALSK